MKHRAMNWLAAGAVIAATCVSAEAQTVLGNTPEAVGQALARGGYDEFRIVKRGLKDVDTHACRGERMFAVRVNLLGRLDVEGDLGRCTLGNRAAQAERPRRTRRFDDGPLPSARGRGRPAAPADSRAQRRIGQVLAQSGYTSIRVLNDRSPFDVRACDPRGREVRLSMTRLAEIRSRRTTGRCGSDARRNDAPRQFALSDVVPLLEERGFDRIEIKRRRAPYIVEACRGDRRLEIVLDAEGRQQDRQRIGRCRTALSEADLTDRITSSGLARVSVTQQGGAYVATACDGLSALTIRYDRFGEEIERRSTGSCPSRSANEILSRLQERGASDVELKVEGCFRGDRYHWTFDRYGDRTSRQRIGSC